ncbi:hypothetical protein D910_00120 [Dendroctonus ponderosae]|uniref:DUF5641 domain-containing protein n=1 Tax=Dendroctonus ponderosae TaxID=77166 RepID=U4UNM6_DENPD|nr:hypothetical protein D910_00120 [Dendroctonus ponderosae]
MQRTLAYILRFLNKAKRALAIFGGVLSVSELDNSNTRIVAALQRQCFSKELSDIKKNGYVTTKCMAKLNPFLDAEGLLRVGSRLEQADVPYSQKHPILLPSRNRMVSLMLRYWPLDGLYATKKVIRECSICFRFMAPASQQIMSDLPSDRVNVAMCVSTKLEWITNRPKWYCPYLSLTEGTVVLLKEDNTPPLKWCLGKIVETLPGKDGKVRAVKLKTFTGDFTRSIAKIVTLPLQDHQPQFSLSSLE